MHHAFIIFRETGELVATSPQIHGITGYGDELASLDEWILRLFPSDAEMSHVSEFIRISTTRPMLNQPALRTHFVTQSGRRQDTLLTATIWHEPFGERRLLIGLHPTQAAPRQDLHLSSATWSGLLSQVEELIEESLTALQNPDTHQTDPTGARERWAAIAQKLARGRHLIVGARRLEQTLGGDQDLSESSASPFSPSR
jgi:hypothetical protein